MLSKCHICNSQVIEIQKYKKYFLVSSDCKPTFYKGRLVICIQCKTIQKPINKQWKDRIKKIYNKYELLSLTLGAKKFNENNLIEIDRSTQIVNIIKKNVKLKKNGKLLDIGCGTGPFIKSFGKIYPKWKLYGLEQSKKYNKYIINVHNFKKLFIKKPENIDIKFDLIVLIHTLEHIVDPINYLIKIRPLLNKDGKLLIEVPDFNTSPFDILVADHSSHFVKENINQIAQKAGFEKIYMENDILPKEISSIFKLSKIKNQPKKNDNNHFEKISISSRINLSQQIKKINNKLIFLDKFILKSIRISKPICIFGTTIAATWFAQSIKQNYFFTDEDESRINKKHMNKKIVPINKIPNDTKIILPFRKDIAKKIIKRLKSVKKDFIVIDK